MPWHFMGRPGTRRPQSGSLRKHSTADDRTHDMTPGRKANMKKRLFFKQRGLCCLCDQLMDESLKVPDPMAITIDHIQPISRGGRVSATDNMRLAHAKCNWRR